MQSMLVFADRNCGTEILHQKELENNPALRAKDLEIENFTRKFIERNAALKLAPTEEIVIPVVFHVVYYSTAQNINDTRIREQIEILNNDFNAINSDISKVPTPFQSAIGSLKVKFVLANRDPNGNVTSGVNRVKTSKLAAFDYDKDDVKYSSQGGVDAWDTRSYMNIWVCNIKDYSSDGGELLGYATFPSNAGTARDGVVLNSKYVGVTGASRPFNLGRTATHEVGHYFNLYHIWGPRNESCSNDDLVADTPNQYTASSGNPGFPKTDNCSNSYPGIMFMNYMDYCNDASLYMFTKGQVSRMEATMSGPRSSLTRSKGYVNDFDIAANKINAPNSNFLCDNSFTPSLRVISNGNIPVTSFSVDFIVDNITYQTTTWTGNIGYAETVNIVFNPVTIENGSYNVAYKIYNANGFDSESKNDTISINIKVGVEGQSLPLTESFETRIPTDGFSVVNSDNGLTWARSSINASTDGSYSIFMNNFDYNPENFSGVAGVFDDIVLPFIDLSDYDQAEMTFDLAACQFTATTVTNNTWDSLQVLVSTDCGETFNVIYNKFAASLITVPVSETFFKPTSASQWRAESIDLTGYTGNSNVLLKIRNISNWENNIYIDKLNIKGNKVTSIKDVLSNVNISMYPNPSKGEVFVKIDQQVQTLKRIEWINTLGQMIEVPLLTPISNNMQFDFSNQPKGIYIANFIFKDGTISNKKLILN